MGGGKIDISGLLEATYPIFDDDRSRLRQPGCLHSGQNTLQTEDMHCDYNQAFWIEIGLPVTVGQVKPLASVVPLYGQ
jgi:hypothetical protein